MLSNEILFHVALLLFALITFGQSAVDKVTDWNGNVNWLKEHFKSSMLKNKVPVALGIVTVLEAITSVLSLIALIGLVVGKNSDLNYWVYTIAVATLLCLLLGQRLAKDYDGARTIVVYLIPFLVGLM